MLGDTLKPSALTKLYLHGASIKHGGGIALAQALRTNSALTVLAIGDNQIGDRGAIALASALRVNDKLVEVYMPRNGITDAGVAELAEALKTGNKTLHTMLLFEYTGIEEALLREVKLALAGRELAARGSLKRAEAPA